MHKNINKSTRIVSVIIVIFSLFIVHFYPIALVTAQTEDSPLSTELEAPPKYELNPETGLWENGIYSWDPATGKTSPLTKQNYSYNPETEHWDTDVWVYDDSEKSYVEKPVKAKIENTGPDSTNNISNPIKPSSISNTGPDSTQSTNSGKIDTTGPNSENKINDNSEKSHFFDNYFDASISNTLNSTASTGDASVLNNTIAGNASTGDATAFANIINLLQSTWGLNGESPKLFTKDIAGDYFGDIMINPGSLKVTNDSYPTNNNLEVKHVENAGIQNNLNLTANSGNATVANNSVAGNATTGDAMAVAQIMNLINSSINAGQSFIGQVNVYGNLEGDVLLPESLTKQLLEAKLPTANVSLSGDVDLDIDTSLVINDNLNLESKSGNAKVANNTIAGSATSGDAVSDVTVFNLIGQQLETTSGILVFVNVAGEWVGFITGAPSGSTTSLVGATPISKQSHADLDADIDRKYLIENNINLTANTGNATVSYNTEAGDALTGDAYTALNLANFVNSSLNFSNIFGVVQLNIFGNWLGSFGTDTAYGGFSTQQIGGIGGEVTTGPIITKPKTSLQTNTLDSQSQLASPNVLVFSVVRNSSGNLIVKPLPYAESQTQEEDKQVSGVALSNSGGSGTNVVAGSNNSSFVNAPILQFAVITASVFVLWRIYLNNRPTQI